MLPRSRTHSFLAHLARGSRAAFAASLGVLSLLTMGCSAISGEHEAEARFPVKPAGQTDFNAWSEVSISEDPSSVTSAELMYVRLEAEDSSIADLGFFRSLYGDVKVGEQVTRVAEKASFPRGERIVRLDVVHEGDIRDFFYEDPEEAGKYVIHIDWSGAFDPSYPVPSSELWIKVRVGVRVDQ